METKSLILRFIHAASQQANPGLAHVSSIRPSIHPSTHQHTFTY